MQIGLQNRSRLQRSPHQGRLLCFRHSRRGKSKSNSKFYDAGPQEANVPYYMGDYYAGDPGFLSFLGKAAKTIGGFIPGIGPAIEAGGAALERVGAKKALPAAAGLAT